MKRLVFRIKHVVLVAAVAACWTSAAWGAPIDVASYTYDGSGQGAQPWTNYPDDGGIELTDGVLPPNKSFSGTPWVGFRDDTLSLAESHPQVTFDLGGLHALDQAVITYLHSHGVAVPQAGGSITAPEHVFISTSVNGVSFTTPPTLFTGFNSADGDEIRSTLLDLSSLPQATHVRLDFRNASQWTFLGEITFTGTAIAVPESSTLATGVIAMFGLLGLVLRKRYRMAQ